ncbi:MAG: DUF1064 domain-containing protein [Firmicutes bacterium]|nr:DUF1064 domain-containing protein [Bacillota bacterium]
MSANTQTLAEYNKKVAKSNKKAPKYNKYSNKKTEVDGIIFDSKAEARYYSELKLRKQYGHIKDFRCQPKFELMPAFEKQEKKYKAMTYIADFEIEHNDGTCEVVDVKGMETAVFKLKQKLFNHKYRHIKLTIHKAR